MKHNLQPFINISKVFEPERVKILLSDNYSWMQGKLLQETISLKMQDTTQREGIFTFIEMSRK